MKNKGKQPAPGLLPRAEPLPRVTIQLPIFNEMYVADRLIDAVCEMDYPRELLEIQVLDDSTDETTEIAELAVRRHAVARLRHQLPAPGRSPRLQGRRARGGPARSPTASSSPFSTPTSSRRPTSCARRCRTSRDPKVGMVQARWGHINQDYSLLTKIQSILLDAHFVLEHGGRNRAGCFFNFNGTAGIWRREAIARRRRLAARHADRRPRPQLPRAAARLALRVPAGPRRAGRSAGRDELASSRSSTAGRRARSRPASSCCRASCARTSRSAVKAEAFFHLTANFNYLLMCAAVGPDVPGDVRPLQHGLDRDAADRHPAVLRGHAVGRQLLHRRRSASCIPTGGSG